MLITYAAAVKNTHHASFTVIDTIPFEKQTMFSFLIGSGNLVGLQDFVQANWFCKQLYLLYNIVIKETLYQNCKIINYAEKSQTAPS